MSYVILVLSGLVAVYLAWRRLPGNARLAAALTVTRVLMVAVIGLMILDPVLAPGSVSGGRPLYVAVLAVTPGRLAAGGAQALGDARMALSRLRSSLSGKGELAVFASRGPEAVETDAWQADTAQPPVGMAAAVRSALSQFAGTRPEALVLLSDGRDAAGAEPEDIAAPAIESGVRLFTVGCGTEARAPAAGIAHISHPDVVRSGATFEVGAALYAHGLSGEARIALAESGRELQSRRITLPPTGGSTFAVIAGEPGVHQYSLAVAPSGNGAWSPDRRDFAVRVLPDKPGLLLIAAAPSPEYATLRRHLASRPDLRLSFVVRKSKSEGLWLDGLAPHPLNSLDPVLRERGLEAAVLMGPQQGLLTPAQGRMLADLVQAGGGLAFVGGGRDLPPNSPLGGLSPLLDAQVRSETPCRPEITVSDAPLARRLRAEGNWGGVPFMSGWSAGATARPDATVIMRAAGGPLLAIRPEGRGRTLALDGTDTYRWKFSADATEASGRMYDALWDRIVDWLTSPVNGTPLAVVCDRDSYDPGTPIRVVTYVTDGAFRPVSDAQVAVYLDAETTPRAMASPSGETGRFEAVLEPVASGSHRVRVVATKAGVKLGEATAEFVVRATAAPTGGGQDSALLRRLAYLGGGVYVPASEVDSLAKQIALPAGVASNLTARHVAREVPGLLVLLALCALDWGMRRRWLR
jgi:hypothetical protein